jgi:hypothetical protein
MVAQDFDLERSKRAAVYIAQVENRGTTQITHCVGSGTIVSENGLILTNAHHTVQSATCPGDLIIISMGVTPDETPIARFRAVVAQANPGIDLAVLRITSYIDGRLVDPDTLSLPFVAPGDSSTLELDDTMTFVGYPTLIDDAVATVRGTASSFLNEPIPGIRSWIKFSAEIPGVGTGGAVYNSGGSLVGIATSAFRVFPDANDEENDECVRFQDSTGDGFVTADDVCIVTGRPFGTIRPVNLARPLIQAALLGLEIVRLDSANVNIAADTAPPRISRIFFASSLNDAGMPSTVISSLPAGSQSLYLFFDYTNMSADTIYEIQVTTDGRPNRAFGLEPVRWSGGQSGLWYIGSANQVWPNGVTEFTVLINGELAASQRILIGSQGENTPQFSDLAFGLTDNQGNLLGNGFVLPTGGIIASARFIHRNLAPGTEWTAIWYVNGTEIPGSRQSLLWQADPDGAATTSVESADTLPAGSYRLELYIQGRLTATSDFIIAGVPRGAFADVFPNPRFVGSITATVPDFASAQASDNYTDELNALYALFDWQQIAPGTLWTLRWLVDSDVIYDQTTVWAESENGVGFPVRLTAARNVPDGTYSFELLLNNIVFATAEAQVGIGQLPIELLGQAEGIQMRGQIFDSDTGLGIPGINFILISQDFSAAEYFATRDESMIYAIATTDNNGVFVISRPLLISTEDNEIAYSAVILAEGYLPMSADGLVVDNETPDPVELVIYMTRD